MNDNDIVEQLRDALNEIQIVANSALNESPAEPEMYFRGVLEGVVSRIKQVSA